MIYKHITILSPKYIMFFINVLGNRLYPMLFIVLNYYSVSKQ